jgi:hypothetical protein
MTNRRLTVWQQITVEISGHPLSGSYAVEDGIVKVKTRASPFGAGITAVKFAGAHSHRRSASRVLVLEPLRAARMKRSRVAAPH